MVCFRDSKHLQSNIPNDSRFNDGKKPYKEAKNLCEDGSGMLYEPKSLSFKDDDNYKAIFAKWQEVKGNYADGWIGIIDSSPSNGIAGPKWVYSKSDDIVEEEFWKNDEPVNGNGDCVVLSKSNGKWFNDDCSKDRNFICEYRKGANFLSF